MIGTALRVTWFPIPTVSSCSAVSPTRESGSVTPGITGICSPTVAVASEKNTMATNVSTSGTRLSSVIRNFADCAVRRASRAARALVISAMILPRRSRCDLPASAGSQRNAGIVRHPQALEDLHDGVVVDLVRWDHEHIGILRVLRPDLRHHGLELVHRVLVLTADVLSVPALLRMFHPQVAVEELHGEEKR